MSAAKKLLKTVPGCEHPGSKVSAAQKLLKTVPGCEHPGTKNESLQQTPFSTLMLKV
ncbi:MAG: hypothetical protein J5I53_02175 [Bradyrhizobiaceae bacterium]|nr:hypothetical protein [Bradyrhizobiaceae bacterium]